MTLRRHAVLALMLLSCLSPALAQTSDATPDDGLNLRFANGIAAIVDDKIVTVDDVRREISPLIPQLQREASDEQDFNKRLRQLQDSVIQSLIDRVLIIHEFKKHDKWHIPDSIVDQRIADLQIHQFDNDRSKFLAYLRHRNMTLFDYRQEVTDDIIYQYMIGQQRQSQNIVSPVKIEDFYQHNKNEFYQDASVHLRLIQLNRTPGESDLQLEARAQEIIARFNRGEKFGDLAREFSDDSRSGKGGDWGWQKKTDLKTEFSDPLFKLKAGQITAPIMTSDGCFILYAEDRKYAGIQPLSDVRDKIAATLAQQMTQESQDKWIQRLRREGYIKRF